MDVRRATLLLLFSRVRLLVPILFTLASGPVLARPHIVIVTATAGFRHDSIPVAESVLASLAEEQGIDVTFVRTPEEVQSRLTSFERVNAVFFVNTTGDLPLNAAHALVEWVRNGGTFVGVHSASDTWHGVPEYLEMLGGEFIGHPPETNGTVIVDDSQHLATQALPPAQVLFEEFYSLGGVDLSRMRMLLSLRVRPEPPFDAGYWPLAWEKAFGQGRVLYTALGHREDVWTSEWFRAHIGGAMQWAILSPGRRRSVRH